MMMDEDEENNTITQRKRQHSSNKNNGRKNSRSLRRGCIHVEAFIAKKGRKKSSTNKHVVHDDDDDFENEFYATSKVKVELLGFRERFYEIGIKVKQPMTLLTDNVVAIKVLHGMEGTL
ncbi:hypothetical protein PsorP6_001325 [Peronosclerospora sorghi]|uniref:Uncharacterized protein n=1 Tax=Peronosclerospora sorghi TaxID=230839 RepID=A0ACC0WU14_9STRA|nr:hypothetical protein PsorP6_001325 [Peronosclerospora sorghi]